MSLLDDFRKFVGDAEAGTQYAKWARDNPGDLARWQIVRDAILKGGRPPIPAMLTAHGRELIDVAVLYLNATKPTPTPAPVLRATITGHAQEGSTLTGAIV